MRIIIRFFSQTSRLVTLAGLNVRSFAHSRRFRPVATLAVCFAIWSIPAFAQFAGGVVGVDPTSGAQLLAKFVVDGLLYVVASAAAVCFFWGLFRLFSRPLEGILEVAVGLIVFGLIGHVLGWDAALTNVVVG